MISRLFKNKRFLVGLGTFTLLVLLSLLGPFILGTDPYEMSILDKFSAPGEDHLFGTDDFGRDLFIRVLYGGRISLYVGLSVSVLSVLLGLIIGLYAGYYPLLDQLLMRICDGLMAIPGILLAIALMAAFSASTQNVILALVIVYTPGTARIVRSHVLQIKEKSYIDAIRIQSASNSRIIWLHIMPNVMSLLVVQMTYIFAGSVISEAALSFLGAGIPAPTPSWGNIIQSGKIVLRSSWWVTVFPSLAIMLSVFSLNLVGEGLSDVLDSKVISYSRRRADWLFDSFKRTREQVEIDYEKSSQHH